MFNLVFRRALFLFPAILICFLLSLNGCRRQESIIVHPNTMKKMNSQQWNHIAGEKIFFGHQSVGYNIVDGIEELNREFFGDSLIIRESGNIIALDSPVFAHARIGENLNPKGKIDDFVRLMRSGMADSLNIACMKLCYVDITRNTDINDLFTYYTSAFEQLQKEFPRTRFIHFTVPLNTRTSGIKGLIKWLIGYDHNINRSRYNAMMRKAYDQALLFDLEAIESTYPDGKREIGPRHSFALVPEYSSDEGHLNEAGRKRVAEQLLLFMAHIDK
jgi:hypothetical protein